MKRLVVLALIGVLIGVLSMSCGKEKIVGLTDYEYDTTIVLDTIIVHDTTIVVDSTGVLDALDYYHALQLWINVRLNPIGRESYFPTVNTYDIIITIDSPTQMTFDMWWPVFNFNTGEGWAYEGLFRIVYNGPDNWQIIDITLSNAPSQRPTKTVLPVQTLR